MWTYVRLVPHTECKLPAREMPSRRSDSTRGPWSEIEAASGSDDVKSRCCDVDDKDGNGRGGRA